jgi:hypothetical protein
MLAILRFQPLRSKDVSDRGGWALLAAMLIHPFLTTCYSGEQAGIRTTGSALIRQPQYEGKEVRSASQIQLSGQLLRQQRQTVR